MSSTANGNLFPTKLQTLVLSQINQKEENVRERIIPALWRKIMSKVVKFHLSLVQVEVTSPVLFILKCDFKISQFLIITTVVSLVLHVQPHLVINRVQVFLQYLF